MKFFVTYCAMDSSLANPLWHACLILSYWPEEGQKIQVTNAWGFYAAPMANPNTIMAKIKKKFGLGFDFQGNHGLLKKEEIRYLDLGHGLRGVTFDISLEQYLQLNKLCRGIQAEQEQAIQEAKQRLAATCAAPSSATIYQEEKNRALSEQRPPRLYPFEFRVSVGMGGGVSLNNSYTCKTMAVSLLKNIGIEQERLDAITHHNTSMALPIFSGQMESFYLYSTGPRCRHVSERTGNITFFRSWQEQGTRLFWSLPPQMLVTNSARLKRLFQLPREYVEPVKK